MYMEAFHLHFTSTVLEDGLSAVLQCGCGAEDTYTAYVGRPLMTWRWAMGLCKQELMSGYRDRSPFMLSTQFLS